MAETQPDFEGAWRCPHIRKLVHTSYVQQSCPPEGCPKGYCARRDDGWDNGQPIPDRVKGVVTNKDRLKEISALGEIQSLNEDGQNVADQMARLSDRIKLFSGKHRDFTPETLARLRHSLDMLRSQVGPW